MFLKLTTLFIDQNELTSIEFISFLPNLKILSAKNNKIQEIPEDFSKSLLTIRLDFNEISKLPQNFENFMSTDSKCISVNTPELSLSFNHFCDNSSNLEEVLWKRLPKKLKFLNLSGNNLVYIPGILSQIQISHLFIDNCNIQHICPIVYTFVSMKDEPRSMIISICDNSELEYLPFVPLSLYQKPPSSKEKISFDYLYNFSFAIITDNESFQNTAKFPMANLKPVYKFEEVSLEEEEQSIGCKCCAICGKATDERAFKNLMIMDFAICFETDVSTFFER
uniref:Leucine rich repeat protein n=1 Tax=Panagrolaimus superbus TaxID=310955 RepID=A0A914ZDJ9_9BILA